MDNPVCKQPKIIKKRENAPNGCSFCFHLFIENLTDKEKNTHDNCCETNCYTGPFCLTSCCSHFIDEQGSHEAQMWGDDDTCYLTKPCDLLCLCTVCPILDLAKLPFDCAFAGIKAMINTCYEK